MQLSMPTRKTYSHIYMYDDYDLEVIIGGIGSGGILIELRGDN